jgi:hypothetical protein
VAFGHLRLKTIKPPKWTDDSKPNTIIQQEVNSILSLCHLHTPLDGLPPHENNLYVITYITQEAHNGSQAIEEDDEMSSAKMANAEVVAGIKMTRRDETGAGAGIKPARRSYADASTRIKSARWSCAGPGAEPVDDPQV